MRLVPCVLHLGPDDLRAVLALTYPGVQIFTVTV